MDQHDSGLARRIARVAIAFEEKRTGHRPQSITVVLGEDTVVITLHNALSPAEKQLAKTPAGAAQVQEFHRQLFAAASAPLREEIARITEVEVRHATAELETAASPVVSVFATGTVVQVFLLSGNLPADRWSGSEPDREP